ncbi:MAG: class I SAM-dependent methyltransferase [Gaiellaceae bacterium]
MLAATVELASLQRGAKVAELGCGFARYLPYLARDHGVRVAGADFSRESIDHTRAALRTLGVDASEIVVDDLLSYCPRHAGEFDAVVSYGLIEHFLDLDGILELHFRCARPGGRVLVCAPNLSGPNLSWARRVAPELLTWHREIAAADVAAVFVALGAEDVHARSLGGPRLFAYPHDTGRPASAVLAKTVRKLFNGFGEGLSRISERTATHLAGERLSSFFVVAGTKPALLNLSRPE